MRLLSVRGAVRLMSVRGAKLERRNMRVNYGPDRRQEKEMNTRRPKARNIPMYTLIAEKVIYKFARPLGPRRVRSPAF